jgi:hypothetical protein
VIFGEENGTRVRSESEHDRFSANLKGKVFHAIQQSLMTQVNAVERANGENRIFHFLEGRKVVMNFHL